MFTKEMQSQKAPLPITRSLVALKICTPNRDVQPENAATPMDSMDLGKAMALIDTQPANARVPICLRPSDKLTSTREAQFANTCTGMVSRVDGSDTRCSDRQLWKALAPMIRNPSGSTISNRLMQCPKALSLIPYTVEGEVVTIQEGSKSNGYQSFIQLGIRQGGTVLESRKSLECGWKNIVVTELHSAKASV